MNRLCEKCGVNQVTEHHHKFSNTDRNRKTYGKKLLNQSFNIQYLCYDCHHNQSLKKYTEREFREEAIKAGYKLPAMNKSEQFRNYEDEK